jgi:uncharacterized repeat protein (TIGR01451 family)
LRVVTEEEARMNAAPTGCRPLATTLFAVLSIASPGGIQAWSTRRPAASPLSQPAHAKLNREFGNLPLAFEPNVGQTDSRVHFLARGSGMMAFFTDTETAMVLSRADRRDPRAMPFDRREPAKVEHTVVRMKLENCSQPRRTIGLEKLPGISNYFIGNDPTKWHTDVPQYTRIQYEGVYPGIDLVWYGNQRRLEYDFVVAAGADPKQIQVAYEGVESLGVEAGGDLVLRTALGEVRQQQPKVYQEIAGKRVEVGAKYLIVAHNRVGFELATYDRQRELRIDPVVLIYSTYLGGSDWGIAVDASGSAYVTGTGYTQTKLTPAGNALLYSTSLGGTGYLGGIAVDGAGSAYVTGWTSSTNFPTQSPYQATNQGDDDVFVTKLSPAGDALIYSTYLGGSGTDYGYGIAVDGAGSAYVTGYSSSSSFPIQSAYQATLKGFLNAFVTKLTPAGTALVYSTYLGGSGWDVGFGIAVDAAGSAYVAGQTTSTDFPTQSPFQATYHGGQGDAFVTKLTPDGSALVYSTYLGGSGDDFGNGIALDGEGSAYITGATKSADFPTQSAYQTTYQGGTWDAFVTKLSPAGNAPAYSTYLGGSGNDYGLGIAVDTAGSAYVAGYTTSPNFPTQFPYQATYQGGDYDAFVTKLTPTGSALVYSTYLGGGGVDYGYGIAVDAAGSAYVTGSTSSSDFPTEAPYQAVAGLYGDAFVAKLSLQSIGLKHTGNFILGQNGVTYTVTVSNLASAGSTSGTVAVTETVPPGLTLVSMAGTDWACPAGGVTCQRSDPLPGGSSYPDITVTVNVASDATSPLVNAVSVGGALTGYATNSTTILPLTAVTVTTSPSGLSIIVDGSSYTAPQSFNWVPLSNHTLNVPSPQGAGTGYIFTNWIDNGQQSRTITTPYSTITYTAEFATQYLLTTSIVPSGAGSIVASPASGNGYYDPGTSVQLTAAPASGYAFSNFSGGLTGGNNPQSVAMSAPRSVTANFVPVASISSLSPESAAPSGAAFTLTVNGTGFISGAAVQWNGTALSTSFVSATQLSASVPATLIASAGMATISVVNPGAVTSGGVGFTIQSGPAATAVSPGAGNGPSQAFTFGFSDPSGYQNLGVLDVLINNYLDGIQACYIALVPSGANAGTLYLVDDGGDAGGPFAGYMALPGTGSVSNSQCTVNGTGSSVVGSGTTITLTLNISFSVSFTGNRIFYTAARDTGTGNSGWQALSTWQVPGATATPTQAMGVTPASGSGASQSFVFTFADSAGWQDLGVVDVLFNNFLDGIQGCYIAYSVPAATLYLVDDGGDAGGPFAGYMALPGTGSVSNSQCTVSGVGSSAAGIGNTLTLTLSVSFTGPFAGNRIFYTAAGNVAGTENSGWHALGAWTVP